MSAEVTPRPFDRRPKDGKLVVSIFYGAAFVASYLVAQEFYEIRLIGKGLAAMFIHFWNRSPATGRSPWAKVPPTVSSSRLTRSPTKDSSDMDTRA
jgi:hypothetical protein